MYCVFRYGIEDVENPRQFPSRAVPEKHRHRYYDVSNHLPPSNIFDPEGYLSPENYRRLNADIFKITKETEFEILVVLVDHIKSRLSPQQFVQGVFDRIGVGDVVDNNGFVLAFIVEDHKIEYQTGKGVRYILRDSHCQEMTAAMRPFLRAGDYDSVCFVP
jgi:uncharacterized protein